MGCVVEALAGVCCVVGRGVVSWAVAEVVGVTVGDEGSCEVVSRCL